MLKGIKKLTQRLKTPLTRLRIKGYLATIVAIGVMGITIVVARTVSAPNETIFDMMVAVSPIWALIIALYLPTRQAIDDRVNAAETAIDFQTKVLENLFSEISNIRGIACAWKNEAMSLRKTTGFRSTLLFVPPRPVYQSLINGMQSVEPQIIAKFGNFEMILADKFNMIEVLRTKDQLIPAETVKTLCESLIGNCEDYILSLANLIPEVEIEHKDVFESGNIEFK